MTLFKILKTRCVSIMTTNHRISVFMNKITTSNIERLNKWKNASLVLLDTRIPPAITRDKHNLKTFIIRSLS